MPTPQDWVIYLLEVPNQNLHQSPITQYGSVKPSFLSFFLSSLCVLCGNASGTLRER
ncbi:hypothetical protein [Nostoc sp. 'Peltigera membranacea cyanobiont' 213]|uniref:hypothetical protein n=1 Tax=Nostoc sp. 'Peltigera membranacea cyanobiont' 213 TaxID=2014530 RepID=UPI00167D9168|nr:hypothetical protein [Nostoc sp. 'Peltigera membranacea cyanobiont' 213]